MRKVLDLQTLTADVRSGLTEQEQLLFDQLRMASPPLIDALFTGATRRKIPGIVARTKTLLREKFPFALSHRKPRHDPGEYLP